MATTKPRRAKRRPVAKKKVTPKKVVKKLTKEELEAKEALRKKKKGVVNYKHSSTEIFREGVVVARIKGESYEMLEEFTHYGTKVKEYFNKFVEVEREDSFVRKGDKLSDSTLEILKEVCGYDVPNCNEDFRIKDTTAIRLVRNNMNALIKHDKITLKEKRILRYIAKR